MSAALISILAPIAAKVGADLIGKVLGGRFGEIGGDLVEAVIGEVAERAGVAPEKLPDLPGEQLENAVSQAEDFMPELIELWSKGLSGQFALLQAEQKEGLWVSGWRWGWMYLLGLMWFVRLMIVPVADALTGADIASGMDLGVMMTLTTWFISLYMGGHTVKALGTTAIDAVKAMRGAK
ncbi:hypothetical protein [Phyllobacterium leguminum]|uniref:Holin (3TMs family) n=1 Tax=Phyllobacterium leguminum TaxID=314237 RepID=A0A318SZP7_9HYPH|nr:hypothetical protein [Phyllobacterium leguminum]PYE86896.1 hypothetical protein C7477_11834 [Phyllobacterium leguminum]